MTNKQWAKEYILDPLTAPEPSQETGLASSHYNALRSLGASNRQNNKSNTNRPVHIRVSSYDDSEDQSKPSGSPDSRSYHRSNYPTPPGSASPTKSHFHPHNPYRNASPSAPQPGRSFSPPNSPSTNHRNYSPSHHSSTSLRHLSPDFPVSKLEPPRRPVSGSWAPSHSYNASFPGASSVQRSASTRTYEQSAHHNRTRLRERYPGDMSHRPLDMLKQETRTAERNHHTRHKPRQLSDTDVIDALDTIGGAYHHGGPYDATLYSRNLNKKYSPVAAVQDTNREALKATPQAYIEDSLRLHRPLQGTATVAPGERDLSGQVMNYEEGADLMREPDAPGGPYKRWTGVKGISYHPDDLKGKGEPSYTIERDAKAKRDQLDNLLAPGEYELQSGANSKGHFRRRSQEPPRALASDSAFGDVEGVRRSHSTGKRLSDGLRRRFGSIKRKNEATA